MKCFKLNARCYEFYVAMAQKGVQIDYTPVARGLQLRPVSGSVSFFFLCFLFYEKINLVLHKILPMM